MDQPLSRNICIFTLSAESEESFRDLKTQLSTYLSNTSENLETICRTSNAGRSKLTYRAALTASSVPDLLSKIAKVECAAVKKDQANSGLVFMFTGQGSQYSQMGSELYAASPIFKAAIDDCAAILGKFTGMKLLELLFDVGSANRLNQTQFTQVAIFSMEYALSQLVRSWGIRPAAVVGHSIGEFAAAVLAGVLDLESALLLVAARGELMQSLPAGGGMHALIGKPQNLAEHLAGFQTVSVAAYNSAENTVISGNLGELEVISAHYSQAGITAVPLTVSHAFHSALMNPILDRFFEVASKAHFKKPSVSFYSTLHGRELAPGEIQDAKYWTDHLAKPVQFLQASTGILESGLTNFVEIGPKPILTGLMKRIGANKVNVLNHFIDDKSSNWQTVSSTLANLFCKGYDIDWYSYHNGYNGGVANLPLYSRPTQANVQKPEVQEERVKHVIQTAVCEVLVLDPIALDDNTDFYSVGMDSILAVQVRNRVNLKLKTHFAPTLVTEHPTLGSLTKFVLNSMKT